MQTRVDGGAILQGVREVGVAERRQFVAIDGARAAAVTIPDLRARPPTLLTERERPMEAAVRRLEKAAGGEGSRGGKIIGRTLSGKPIYASADHESHRSFTRADHHDAADRHADLRRKADKYLAPHHHDQQLMHERAASTGRIPTNSDLKAHPLHKAMRPNPADTAGERAEKRARTANGSAPNAQPEPQQKRGVWCPACGHAHRLGGSCPSVDLDVKAIC